MKKITLIFAALCCMCLTTKAQTPVITVADVEAVPGETVAFSLNLSGGKAGTYTSLQCDVHIPVSGITTTVSGYQIYPSSIWPGSSATIGAVDASGNFTIAASSSSAITSADTENLISVELTVGSGVANGVYECTVSNIQLGYGTSDKDTPANTTFNVNVVARHTAVLDEESTELPANATGVDVTVKRSLKAGIWNTICLPFAMTADQITAAFGEGTLLGDFDGCESVENNDEETTSITVKFTSVSTIEANHPYIIKMGKTENISQFTVENVNIAADEDNAIVEKDHTSQKIGKTTYHFYNRFFGSLKAGSKIDKLGLFLNNNKFYYSDGDTSIKAFRGYFFFDTLSLDEAYNLLNSDSRMFIVYDGEVTAIEPVKAKPAVETGVYYNLMGVAVKNPSKGVFIKDGKKIVVK